MPTMMRTDHNMTETETVGELRSAAPEVDAFGVAAALAFRSGEDMSKWKHLPLERFFTLKLRPSQNKRPKIRGESIALK